MDAIAQAAYDTVHNCEMGTKELARRMGIPHQVLINKVNPNCDSNHLLLHQAVVAQEITKTRLITNAMVAVLGDVDGDGPMELLQAVLHAEAEHGDIAKAIYEALEDRRMTPRERQKVLREIGEAKAALADLERSVVVHDEPQLMDLEVQLRAAK